MPIPTGVGYTVDALSGAIDNLFKGMIQGQNLALQQEEASRQNRESWLRQAMFPEQFRHAGLQNQYLADTMQQTRERHPWALKQDEANLAATQENTKSVTSARGRAEARHPLEMDALKWDPKLKEAQYNESVQALDLRKQELKNLEAVYPYLAPDAKAAVELKRKQVEEADYSLNKARRMDENRIKALPKMLEAMQSKNPTRAMFNVFAEFELDHKDPMVLGWLQEMQTLTQGRLNASHTSAAVGRAEDDASKWAGIQFFKMFKRPYDLSETTPEERAAYDWLHSRKKAELLREQAMLGIPNIPESSMMYQDMPMTFKNRMMNDASGWFGIQGQASLDRGEYADLLNYYQKHNAWDTAQRMTMEELQRRKDAGKVGTPTAGPSNPLSPYAPMGPSDVPKQTPAVPAPAPKAVAPAEQPLHPSAKTYLELTEKMTRRNAWSTNLYKRPYDRLPPGHQKHVDWLLNAHDDDIVTGHDGVERTVRELKIQNGIQR